MYKMVICVFIMLSLTSCSFFSIHKQEIEQGNIITTQLVSQLHPGLSEDQVKAIMGTPVLENIFSVNHVEYVYTFESKNQPRIEDRITCIFKDGILVNVYRR